MKRGFKFLLMIFSVLVIGLFVVSCSHTHSFSKEWTYNATSHWHASTCGHDVKADEAEHTFGEWIVRTPATEEAEGLEYRVCTVCGYEETRVIPKLEKQAEDTPTPETKTFALYDAIYSGSYYNKITTELLKNPTSLKSTLHTIISANHTKLSYSKAFDALDTIDSYDGGDYVECLYTGEKMDPSNHGYWNREHVWAKSHGIKTATDKNESERCYAYTDLHHLRATENSINSTRNNRYFDVVDHNTSSKDEYGNYWDNGDVFEPRDEVKGDIARMLLYMDVRYEGDEASQYLNLTLTNDLDLAKTSINYVVGTTETITGYLGNLSTLIKWSFEDPVDSREISRNNAIYTTQGNRNPFIDHPELVFYLYSEEALTLEYTINNLEDVVSPKLKDTSGISSVESLITKIGTVTVNSEALITRARTAYNNLDNISKSFVSNYNVLIAAEEKYEQLTTVQNEAVDTEFSFLVLKGNKTGDLFSNGIYLNYSVTSSTAPSDSYGIYSQNNKPVTLKAKGLYESIKKLVFYMDTTSGNAVTGTITVADGTKTVTENVTVSSLSNFSVDVSSLDSSKEWTITTSSGTSWRIRKLTFSIK